ncbi:MAG TPA: ABC transporter permease [Acidimicrobiia bacterium]|jgi:peptide/nickel transport system permease protein|nr:ABC transporter permease [Acidimicrobiia bacterium]
MSAPRRPATVMPEPEPLGPSEMLPGLPVDDPYRSSGQRFWRRLRRHRPAVVSAVVLVLLAAACFAAPLLAPYGPNQQNLALGAVGPSLRHWFGTDELGRDELSRLLYAGQISLEIGLAVALLSTLVGTIVGAVAGYVGKATDQALMRVTDLFLVLPALAVLALALEKFGHDRLTIILVLAALFWMYVARVVRAQVLAIKEQEYVEAARASGASGPWIVWRHVLPNCVGPIVVNATLAVAAAIIAESALSFLGFGVQLPATSWGRMLADAEGYIGTSQAYLLYFPGLAILVTVLAINFLGDGLRDAFDPRGA